MPPDFILRVQMRTKDGYFHASVEERKRLSQVDDFDLHSFIGFLGANAEVEPLVIPEGVGVIFQDKSINFAFSFVFPEVSPAQIPRLKSAVEGELMVGGGGCPSLRILPDFPHVVLLFLKPLVDKSTEVSIPNGRMIFGEFVGHPADVFTLVAGGQFRSVVA